jgi:signal transduction histidine kinase
LWNAKVFGNSAIYKIKPSITQIAILTEVARSQTKNLQNGLDAPLAKVSGVAMELTAAMGDIVWAINPRKDNLRDLVQRMRRFAADVFTSQAIKFEFDAPDVEVNAQIGANLRREFYVIFKEAVNNVARHSEATRAEISLTVFADSLALKVSDNGRGFDLSEKLSESFSPDVGGNGLINLRRRGAELGGRCEIISFAGGGTTVLLEIPLHTDNITTQMDSENDDGKRLR